MSLMRTFFDENKKESFAKVLIIMISSRDFKTRKEKTKLLVQQEIGKCLAGGSLKKFIVPLARQYLPRSKLQMRQAPEIRKSKVSERHYVKMTLIAI